MFAIIVSTHGDVAREMVKTCEFICGKLQNLRAVTLRDNETADDVFAKYKMTLKSLDTGDGVLFLCDVFGGSPYNAACRLVIGNENYGIVSGVNMTMLIEMVNLQMGGKALGIKELVVKAAEAGKAGIQTFHASAIAEEI